MQIDWKAAEKFFLEASAKTYAGGEKEGTIVELPRSKVLRYQRGEFTYRDCYFTSPEKGARQRRSFGATMLWQSGVLFWRYCYGGWWNDADPRVIPFLRQALSAAYRAGTFVAGRGPATFYLGTQSPLIYYNNVDDPDFLHPKCEDFIRDPGKPGSEPLYVHTCHGGALT